MDIVNEIAERLGLEVEVRQDAVRLDLPQPGAGQVRHGRVGHHDHRRATQKTVDFSDPYFLADQSLMVKKGSDIKTVDDVAGKIVGAQLGTTGADYAKDKTDAEEVRTYDLIDDAFKALADRAGRRRDQRLPGLEVRGAKSKPDLQVVERDPHRRGLRIRVRRRATTTLREAVNGALDEIKEDGTTTRSTRSGSRRRSAARASPAGRRSEPTSIDRAYGRGAFRAPHATRRS